MGHEYTDRRRVMVSHHVDGAGGAEGPVVFSSTGVKFRWAPSAPVDVYKWGFIVGATALDNTTGLVMALKRRPNINSASSEVTMDTITFTNGAATVAANKGRVRELTLPVAASTGLDGSTVNVEGAGPVRVKPGEQLTIEVTTGATAGNGYLFIEYDDLPSAGSDFTANMVKI